MHVKKQLNAQLYGTMPDDQVLAGEWSGQRLTDAGREEASLGHVWVWEGGRAWSVFGGQGRRGPAMVVALPCGAGAGMQPPTCQWCAELGWCVRPGSNTRSRTLQRQGVGHVQILWRSGTCFPLLPLPLGQPPILACRLRFRFPLAPAPCMHGHV